MQSEAGASDTMLETKVAAMRAATGEAKIAAMEAVLNELLEERRTFHEKIARVHGAMLEGCPTMQPAESAAAEAGAGKRPR